VRRLLLHIVAVAEVDVVLGADVVLGIAVLGAVASGLVVLTLTTTAAIGAHAGAAGFAPTITDGDGTTAACCWRPT